MEYVSQYILLGRGNYWDLLGMRQVWLERDGTLIKIIKPMCMSRSEILTYAWIDFSQPARPKPIGFQSKVVHVGWLLGPI